MLATPGNQSSGISFWFDCYKSDWETTDWLIYLLIVWLSDKVGGAGGVEGR